MPLPNVRFASVSPVSMLEGLRNFRERTDNTGFMPTPPALTGTLLVLVNGEGW